MNNKRSAQTTKSKTFRMLETLGINLSPETYGDISPMKLVCNTLRLWKNEILQKIAYYSVFMTPTPLAARIFVPFLHKLRGVSIGEDCFIDSCVLFDSVYPELISIGKNVSITKGCIILAHQRDLKGYTGKEILHKKGYKIAKVVIGDNVLIGSGSIILPGVKIGKGSVVGAGSVVTKDVPPGVLVAGIPAKVIKSYIPKEDE